MNYDLQMTEGGDLYIDNNDVKKTESIKQAIMIHLRWFLAEWVFGPQFGIDYFGQVFIKKPISNIVLGLISDEVRKVEGVSNVKNLSMVIDNATRRAVIKFTVVTTSMEEFYEEVDIWQAME